ncbi:MAG: hypothetical protein PHX38_00655 [Sulfuricella sp.]|nr:hypothetical protein [Sulfuricella sp.]
MAEFLTPFLAGLSVFALLAACGVFCHGLFARAQMARFRRAAPDKTELT